MFYKTGFVLLFALAALPAFSQTIDSHSSSIVLPASSDYHKSEAYQRKWGKHYREEWHKPVSFLQVNLDTLAGGLTAYEAGGGRQSKSLRLRDKNNREYVLRSIDKSFGNALPDITAGTFIEDFANDQVTFSHPYGALIVAPLAEAAGILHTNPQIFYVPMQPALGTFNKSHGGTLYLFEQRPDEDWATATNFGNSEKIIGTEKLFEKLLEENDHKVDQAAFVKARLFDMLIGDWGRHEDQWRWASFKKDGSTTYLPIPRDRDNAFSKLDGSFIKPVTRLAGASHMQNFGHTIDDVNAFNFPARYLDRRLLNELTLQQWLDAAADVQRTVTDYVIETAVKKLPAEVYPISGPAIAAMLKSRRSQLHNYAATYYQFLGREVDIVGTKENEQINISAQGDTSLLVSIYNRKKNGEQGNEKLFERSFNPSVTKEIRFYGIDGNDSFHMRGAIPKSITVRLVGGPGKDNYSSPQNGERIANLNIYDDRQNSFDLPKAARLRLSKDSAVHAYNYKEYSPGKKGVRPVLFYSQVDRVYAGLRYTYQKAGWRKRPFAAKHILEARYSLGQKAPSFIYSGNFPAALGKWDMLLFANYDLVVWTNFYGLGNETIRTTEDRDYNRVRSRQLLARIGTQRVFNNRHKVVFAPFYQNYDVINDTARYLSKTPGLSNETTFRTQHFAGAGAEYVYQHVNDSVLPVKGIALQVGANYTRNLGEQGDEVSKLFGEANFFIPLTKKFNLYLLAGGATLKGDPLFYQYNSIASSQNIRGYRRDRFYGNSSFYNQNELRFITDVRSYYYSGKFGVFALYDVGRVWLKGEESNLWHTSYGGGIILSPFNKISVSAAYAISKEDRRINVRLLRPL